MNGKVKIVTVLVIGILIGSGVTWVLKPVPPREFTHIRVDLGWSLQGPHAPFFIADEKGYFAEEGITVEIEPGTGAPDQIRNMIGGLYDAGLLDFATLTELKAKENVPLKNVFCVYNGPGIATIALKNYGIAEPKDLEGHPVGAPVVDIGYRLFPAFAKKVGIDIARVEFVPVTFMEREAYLVNGQVHAITGIVYSMLGVEEFGVPEENIVVFDYKNYGVDIYGAGIVFTNSFIEDHPGAVEGFLRALTRGQIDAINDPDYAIEVMQKREPLLDPVVERKRFDISITMMIDTPEVREHGFGYYDKEKLEGHIDTCVDAFDLTRRPSVDELYTDEFLLRIPLEDRMLPLPYTG